MDKIEVTRTKPRDDWGSRERRTDTIRISQLPGDLVAVLSWLDVDRVTIHWVDGHENEYQKVEE